MDQRYRSQPEIRSHQSEEEKCVQWWIAWQWWIAVAEKEGDQLIKYLLNSNGTVTLSNLHEDFLGVTGLRYLNKANNRSKKVHCDMETCNPGPKLCSHTYIVTRNCLATISVAEEEGDQPVEYFPNSIMVQ